MTMWALLSLFHLGCDGPGTTGTVTAYLQAEGTISEGLDPGGDLEHVIDGWRVRFDRFVVVLGRVGLARSRDDRTFRSDTIHAIDLTRVSAMGVPVARFLDVPVGQWDFVTFRLGGVGSAMRDPSVMEADFAEMQARGCSYLIAGRIEDPEGDGIARPPGRAMRTNVASVRFRFCVPVEVAHGPCQAEDGLPGIVVTTGSQAFDLTAHGDHLLFDGFPEGPEIVHRRAQWLADADLDGDGEVEQSELESIDAAALFRDPDYSLGGSPVPIRTAWDFVRAQVATQMHFQGEGECVIEVE
jgi:hypothetical protein